MQTEQEKQEMLLLYTEQHMTLHEIGTYYGFTRERVRQVLTIYPEYHNEKNNASKTITLRSFARHAEKRL